MKRQGTIIAAVLIVTALVAMVAVGLLYQMQAETAAAAAGSDGQQAYFAAYSGIQYAVAIARASRGERGQLMGRCRSRASWAVLSPPQGTFRPTLTPPEPAIVSV